MGTATISYGPNLRLINNAAINQVYVNQLRQFLQAMDQLIMGSVINATTVVPPSSPSNGDAYLLSNTPSGAWTGYQYCIAVWTTQATNAGTNTLNPAWVFYGPQTGWIIWNKALASLMVNNGAAWVPLAGGANFPTNTDITSMTGIPNTTFNSTGYAYNDGTLPPTYIGDAANTAYGAGTDGNGFFWGTGTWASPTTNGSVIVGLGPWTGLDASGVGVGVGSLSGATVMVAEGLQTTGGVTANAMECLGQMQVPTGPFQCNVFEGYGTTANTVISFTTQAACTTVPAYEWVGGGSGIPGANAMGVSSYGLQTTVGAAGSASTLPVAPTGYLPFWVNGTLMVIPYYAHA